MQAPSWSPPGGTLGRIAREAEMRAEALRPRRAELERSAARAADAPSLASALRRKDVAIIAEVKRRSPSKGWIARNLDAGAQARAYELGGAAAISVLTEPAHFAGSVDDLVAVREAVALPTIKKDFHVDPLQLLEARAIGASAALLIARALAPDRLEAMLGSAQSLGIEVIVEVRDAAELARALEGGASIVGINNRDLETLAIDPATSERILSALPERLVGIAESGVRTREDVARYGRVGAHAVLVGSSISAAAEPAAAVRALAGVERAQRAR